MLCYMVDVLAEDCEESHELMIEIKAIEGGQKDLLN